MMQLAVGSRDMHWGTGAGRAGEKCGKRGGRGEGEKGGKRK